MLIPLHVESVALVAERKDVLSTFFGLLSLWTYGIYAQEKSKPARRARSICDPPPSQSRFSPAMLYLFSLFLFALALMSKAMAVTLPFVMLLLDYWPLRRFQLSTPSVQFSILRRLALEKLPFLALTIVTSCLSALLLNHLEVTRELPGVGLGDRLIRPFVACQFYLAKMFWPTNLAVPYLRPPQWPTWEMVSAVIVFSAISIGAFCQARRRPYLLFGWCWFLGALVPVIGLVPLGAHLMADRYTYFPLVGLFIALVWLASEITSGRRYLRAALATVAGVVVLACVTATTRQLRYWSDSGTLFLHTLSVTRNNYVAHLLSGHVFFSKGKNSSTHLLSTNWHWKSAPIMRKSATTLPPLYV